jgi:hypothetical protein
MTQDACPGSSSAHSNGYLSIFPILEQHESEIQLPPCLRNGIILPLYSSLAEQLCAIARILNLSSTEGLSLYLYQDGQGYAGPNIGASVWPMIWHKNFNSLEHHNATSHRQQQPIANSSSQYVVARVELMIEGKAAAQLIAENVDYADGCHQGLDYNSGVKRFGNA